LASTIPLPEHTSFNDLLQKIADDLRIEKVIKSIRVSTDENDVDDDSLNIGDEVSMEIDNTIDDVDVDNVLRRSTRLNTTESIFSLIDFLNFILYF